jgi:hypothetical protein
LQYPEWLFSNRHPLPAARSQNRKGTFSIILAFRAQVKNENVRQKATILGLALIGR